MVFGRSCSVYCAPGYELLDAVRQWTCQLNGTQLTLEGDPWEGFFSTHSADHLTTQLTSFNIASPAQEKALHVSFKLVLWVCPPLRPPSATTAAPCATPSAVSWAVQRATLLRRPTPTRPRGATCAAAMEWRRRRGRDLDVTWSR